MLRFQTFWKRSLTKKGAKRESHACKQCAAQTRHLKLRQTYKLHTAVRLRADFSSDVRLFSQQPHASVLREGSRLSAVSNFVRFDVSDFDLSWQLIWTPLFRTFLGGSDESECDRAVGQHPPPIAQISLSSSYVFHSVRLMSLMLHGMRLCNSLSLNLSPKIHISQSISVPWLITTELSRGWNQTVTLHCNGLRCSSVAVLM